MRPVRAYSTSGVISARSTPMPERRCWGVKYSERASKTIAAENRSAMNRNLRSLYREQAKSNGLHPAAVHRNRNSCDIAGALRGEEHDQIRKLFRRADTAKRNLRF